MTELTHAVRTAIGEAQLHQANTDVDSILAKFQEDRGTDRSIHARAMHVAQQQLDALNARMLRDYSMNPPQAWNDRYATASASLAWEGALAERVEAARIAAEQNGEATD